MRVVGSLVIPWLGSSVSTMYVRHVGRRSWSYDPALAQQPVIPFSVDLRDIFPLDQVQFRILCPIGTRLSQPSI